MSEMIFGLTEVIQEIPMLTILDVGAMIINESKVSEYSRLVKRGARVFGFEPNAAECDKLKKQYGEPHKFFPYFIGDGTAQIFHETTWTATGSLYEPNTPLLERFNNLSELMSPVARHHVETKRLDDIEEIRDVDFFKIDVQGAELAVFQGAQRLLESAVVIHTEVEFVEMYKGQPLFADVDTYLRHAGFSFHTFQGFGGRAFKPMVVNNDPNQAVRQFLWADAIYIKDFLHLDRLSDEKLLKLALILHDQVESWDLCRYVLGIYDDRNGTQWAIRYLAAMVDFARRKQNATSSR
jgi:FkbM family methyltransferase